MVVSRTSGSSHTCLIARKMYFSEGTRYLLASIHFWLDVINCSCLDYPRLIPDNTRIEFGIHAALCIYPDLYTGCIRVVLLRLYPGWKKKYFSISVTRWKLFSLLHTDWRGQRSLALASLPHFWLNIITYHFDPKRKINNRILRKILIAKGVVLKYENTLSSYPAKRLKL